MPGDPFYATPLWRRLCAVVARRSGGRCEAPGCSQPARVVDHIVSRRRGGPDTPDNLRHLCVSHDNAVKENERGERRRGGILPGCDASGVPTDPAHPWHAGPAYAAHTLRDDNEGTCPAHPPTGSNIQPVGGRDRPGPRIRSKFWGPQ